MVVVDAMLTIIIMNCYKNCVLVVMHTLICLGSPWGAQGGHAGKSSAPLGLAMHCGGPAWVGAGARPGQQTSQRAPGGCLCPGSHVASQNWLFLSALMCLGPAPSLHSTPGLLQALPRAAGNAPCCRHCYVAHTVTISSCLLVSGKSWQELFSCSQLPLGYSNGKSAFAPGDLNHETT